MLNRLLSGQRLFAGGAVEDRDGNSPDPLSGDAPVRTILDHPVDPVPAPGRDPGHLIDRFKGISPQSCLLHRDEPLLRRPEDDGVVRPPAMGIRVDHHFLFQERSCLLQLLIYGGVGIENELSRKERNILCESSIVIHRAVDLKPVLDSGLIVLLSMARCCVNTSRADIESDIGRKDDD